MSSSTPLCARACKVGASWGLSSRFLGRGHGANGAHTHATASLVEAEPFRLVRGCRAVAVATPKGASADVPPLPAVARLVAERDNAIRASCLNVMEVLYGIEGDGETSWTAYDLSCMHTPLKYARGWKQRVLDVASVRVRCSVGT